MDRSLKFLTICTDLTQRRLFMLKAIVFVYIASSLVSMNPCTEEIVPASVSRRLSWDIINFAEPERCDCIYEGNFTYMVDERQCVNNQDLLNDCRFIITPKNFRTVHRITVNIALTESNPVLRTVDMNNNFTTAIIVCREECQDEQDPDASCQIDSLEVYRGREQTHKIGRNHGFSITNNRTIKINRKTITYSIEELPGELYRMNLSCPLIGSGCVFFKIAGVANVTHAKFHDQVLGTFKTSTTAGNERTMSTPVMSKESTSPSSSMILDIATYTIVGVAGFLILLFIMVLLGTILLYGRTKDKRRKL